MTGWRKIAKKSSISFFNYEAKVTVHLECCQTKLKKKKHDRDLISKIIFGNKELTLKHTKALKAKSCAEKCIICLHKFLFCLIYLYFCMAQKYDTNMLLPDQRFCSLMT